MKRPAWDRNGWARRGIALPTLMLLLWTSFIAYGTMIPFNFQADYERAADRLRGLSTSFTGPISRSDVLSNVLLFMPWGFLYSIRSLGRGGGVWKSVAGALLGGMALSCLVELAQLFLPSRTTSPVDLVTNTSGATIGALAGWGIARWAWPAWSTQLGNFVVRRPQAFFAMAAGVGLAVAGLSPFDVSLDYGDLKSSFKRARLVPFGPSLGGTQPPAKPWSSVQEGLNWSLAGGLVVLALREAKLGGFRVVGGATILCGGLAWLIEVAQLAIPGRTSDATTVACAMAGSVVGAAAVASFWRMEVRRWVGLALAVWAASVTLAAWTPPSLATSLRWPPHWSQLVPFLAYHRRTDIYAVADLLDQVLGFIPAGVLLAAGGRRWPVRTALLAGLGFSILLEVGQLGLADRTFDITDALSAGAGATLGAWLWGWATQSRA